jgi:predicted dehydrogenase/predicted TIM-barrel fold metal-dependent hydrolase
MQPLERRTLKVGLAGAGSISFNHLVAWKTVPDVKVVAIANPTIQKAQARAAEFGILAHYNNVADMLDKHDLDILDIASSRSSHPENIRLAATRGVHILCQKPLANTLAESEQLVGEVEGVVRLMVNDNRRFRSDFRQIAAWIRDGEVGTIRQGVMVMFRSGFLPGADGRLPAIVQWPAMAKETRLLIAESLIHQLDVLRFLLGDMAVIACRAKRTEESLLGETMATIFLETGACAPVVLVGSYIAPGFGVAVSDRLELIGSRASVLLDNGTLSLLGAHPQRLTYDMKKEYQHCFDAAVRHFVDCLRSNAPFESSARDNLRTLRLVEDAYAKAAEGPCPLEVLPAVPPEEFRVANSGGTGKPKLRAPAHACDCHIHLFDSRFPPEGPAKRLVTNASAAEYRLFQKRIGTTRVVVVTPSAYGTANAVTLDGIARFGLANARGVVVVNPGITDSELRAMADGGIRGIRFTLFDPATSVTSFDMIEPLARRVNDLGWHVQLHLAGDQIVEHEALLMRIVSPIVFDHMGRFPQPQGLNHPANGIIRRLIDKGKTWVKLSSIYQDTKTGPPTYADQNAVASAYLQAAPERMVWGSDWPHPTERHEKPDDALIFDLIAEWAPDEALRQRLLVDNPAILYDFPRL